MLDLPIYLDHASTTPVSPDVLEEMLPYFSSAYGNPASLHACGAEAREAVEVARQAVADAIGARPEEVVFTGGGTEADNAAIKGAARASRTGRREIVVSSIEHHAVLHAADALALAGWRIVRVPVDRCGVVELDALYSRISEQTLMVSVMYANNEVGAIQPVVDAASICASQGALLHVDAVQAFGQMPIDVRTIGADMVTLSSHKVYGPKGVGALWVRRGVAMAPLLDGGGQERGLRGGTLDVPGIVGFGRAAAAAAGRVGVDAPALRELRDRMIAGIRGAAPDAVLCGPEADRLPNNVHFCFPGLEGEALVLAMDAAGVCCSAGAACSSGSVEPSHVLLAMGLDRELARGAVRLSLGRSTTAAAVDYAVGQLAAAVRSLRQMSLQPAKGPQGLS